MLQCTELVCVQLMKSLCLPVLLYAFEVLPLAKSEIATLSHVLDRAVYRIFGCSSAEDTKFIRTVIDLLSVDLCIARRLHKFVQKYAVTYTWSSLFSYYYCVLAEVFLVISFCIVLYFLLYAASYCD